MTISEEEISLYFSARRKELAGLILLLVFLPVGGEIKALNGKIIKMEENLFRLDVDDDTLEDISHEWINTNVDAREELFSSDSKL